MQHTRHSERRLNGIREGQRANERSPRVGHDQSGRAKLWVALKPSHKKLNHLLPGRPCLAFVHKLNRFEGARGLVSKLNAELEVRHIAKL